MSNVRKIALEVKWHIENVESWLQNRDDILYSPQFIAETLSNTRWKLSLSANRQLAENYVSFTLLRDVEDGGPKALDLTYELSVLKGDGLTAKSKSWTGKFASKTASNELNLKQVEILKEKREDYLCEGVLTVCCKLWNTLSTVSKGQCLILRSVIGTKCLVLNATINDIGNSSHAVANFSSPDISISLDVYLSSNSHSEHQLFVFKRKHVECKSLISYSFTLVALGITGYEYKFEEIFDLTNLDLSHEYANYSNSIDYLPNGTLTLQLEISYHPGIVTESTEKKLTSYENLPYLPTDPEDVNACDSKAEPSVLSDGHSSTDPCIEVGQISDDDDCFEAPGKTCLPSTTLKTDLTSLYNDRLFCDTKLQTDTETFPAHRNVLSARSPVFKKMFTTAMKEKAGECINVPDMSSDTVRRMLQFLYTDCTGDLDMQSAKDLYIASDKYDIASLKQRCTSFLVENLSPANVCEVLVLADMHQDKDLESAAQEYVLTNDDEVFYSDEWKLFMKNYGCLAAQVMYLKFTKK